MKTLRTIFNVARRQQLVTFNPAEAVELPAKIQQVKRRTFTPEQVEIILREAADAKDLNGAEWQSAILFGYYAAMRLGDAVSRRWEEVDLSGRKLEFQDRKTRKQIVVPLHPRLEQHLSDLAGDANGFICPRLAKVTIGGRSGLSKQFAILLRRAGISQASQATGGQRMLATLSFHSLRKTFNSELYNADVTQEVRKKLTGHKSDAVNDRYTESKLAPLRKAVDKLPKLARLNERQLQLRGLEPDKK